MTIGLIDVDGHRFPNLALMRLSAYHKSIGDTVEWWDKKGVYDIVYKSKIFSDAYSKDTPDPENTKVIIRGGTGYCISLKDGKEVFNTDLNIELDPAVERMKPDYTIYPQYDFAVSMTSRGCPRQCPFCHVSAKEGCKSRMVASVDQFYSGQKHIEVLDPNITACRDKRELFEQYIETRASINFNQGLDIRLLTGEDIDQINRMRVKDIHFAWDNPEDDLEEKFRNWVRQFRRRSNIGMVYVLVNYGSTMEQNLHRIYTLRDLGFDPYVMVYDKPNAPQEIVDLQRWCNNKIIFKKTRRFEDYVPTRNRRKP